MDKYDPQGHRQALDPGEVAAVRAVAFAGQREAITWSMSTRMMLDKSCLWCKEQWGMHHRCPALGGRWNCC